MDEIRTEVISDKYTDEDNSDAFSEFQGAILWPRRSLLYRICFLALLPLFAVFLLGFSSPFWMKKHQVDKYRGYYNLIEKVDVSIGLWRVCEGADFSDITDCTSLPDVTSYMMACQAMLCLCLIFTVFSLIFGLYENCATRYDMDEGNEAKTKRPEMNAITAGIFGMIGVGMYGAIIIDVARIGDGAVHWAFPVTTASVTGIIVCGILMAIANPIHSTTQGFPGQIMSLSRQNSIHIREPSIQDRLVAINESVGQSVGQQASMTMYGVTGNNPDSRETPFLQRSESCLSSHMSSPDLYTAASQDQDMPHGQRGTHVVETYDIYARTHDQTRRQLRQQLQNKTAQRRSWHFDDRNGAYIVSDLINRPTASLPSEARAMRELEGGKPPVPPRRDKIASQANANRAAMNQTLQAIPDEASDLMVLDDPVMIAPGENEPNQNTDTRKSDLSLVKKRNTNPFIEDDSTPPLSHPQNELEQSKISTESWDSQPWPDPPSESEILGQIAPPVPDKNAASESTMDPPCSPSDSVPESMQYQPQNYASLSRKQNKERESTAPYKNANSGGFEKPEDTHPQQTKGTATDRPHRHGKKGVMRKAPPPPQSHVPVMKEYDNPLFKPQTAEDSRGGGFEEKFSLKICDSTSFVHPSPTPPAYYTVVDTVQSEPTSYRRHSSHYSYSPKLDDRENPNHSPRQLSHEGNPEPPPAYTRHNKQSKDTSKKHSTPREKTRVSNKQHQQHNGGVKSRPRQVKREHQQRRSGHPDAGSVPQQLPSPQGGYYGSSPDLVSKSPKQSRRRPGSAGIGEGPVSGQTDYNRNVNGRTPTPTEYRAGPYNYDTNRQSPYYTTRTGQYHHWGDSDL